MNFNLEAQTAVTQIDALLPPGKGLVSPRRALIGFRFHELQVAQVAFHDFAEKFFGDGACGRRIQVRTGNRLGNFLDEAYGARGGHVYTVLLLLLGPKPTMRPTPEADGAASQLGHPCQTLCPLEVKLGLVVVIKNHRMPVTFETQPAFGQKFLRQGCRIRPVDAKVDTGFRESAPEILYADRERDSRHGNGDSDDVTLFGG